MNLTEKQLTEIIDKILYGDIHEVPLSTLKDVVDVSEEAMETWDKEQLTRVSVAATIKEHVWKNVFKINK